MFRLGKWFLSEAWKEFKKQDEERKKCAEVQRKMFEYYVGNPPIEAIITDLDRLDYGYNIAKITWNEAIEAAAIVCADKISKDAVRMLKK